jgi:hypothetical protein
MKIQKIFKKLLILQKITSINKIMNKNIAIWILSILFLFLQLNTYSLKNMLLQLDNKIIWESTNARVEWNISFIARVDTGAQTTSIHAENLKIKNEETDIKKNIWKKINFTIVNNSWKKETFTKIIKDVRKVKTSEWTELRYYVLMDILVKDTKKSVLVNLNNREEMNYKLLLWRNFLSEDFLIKINEK